MLILFAVQLLHKKGKGFWESSANTRNICARTIQIPAMIFIVFCVTSCRSSTSKQGFISYVRRRLKARRQSDF